MHSLPILRRFLLTGLAVGLLLTCQTSRVKAELLVNGITVAPALATINLKTDDDQQMAYIGVKNNYSTPISLTAQLKGVDQNSGILAPVKDLDTNLASLISVAPAYFTLEPEQSINIQISVKNGTQLNPGGNYAALVIKRADSGFNDVSLQSAISVSLFVIKEQGAQWQLKLNNLHLQRWLWELPTTALVTVSNNGNVVAVPRGYLTVSDNKLNVIYQKGILNEASLSVWPNKQLTMDMPVKTIISSWWPGWRTVTLQYRSTDTEEVQSFSTSLLYLPTGELVAAGLILIICGWLAIKYRKNLKRLFKQSTKKVVPRSTNSAKPVKKIVVLVDD
jgi:hypothetical protein